MGSAKESKIAISPDNELEFFTPIGKKYSKTMLKLTNTDDVNHAAFKVKTTSPKRYCVRPSCGVIAPGDSVMVEMSLLAKEMDGMTTGLTTDKFLIQQMVCDASFQPKEKKDEFKNPDRSVRDSKLRVRLNNPKGGSSRGVGGAAGGGLIVTLLLVLAVLVAAFYAVHSVKPELTQPLVDKVSPVVAAVAKQADGAVAAVASKLPPGLTQTLKRINPMKLLAAPAAPRAPRAPAA